KPFTKNYGELICCHWAGSTLKWQRVSGIARVRLVLALGTAGRSTGVIDERLSEDSPRSLLTKVVGRVTAALLFATVLGQSDIARAAPQAAAADFTEAAGFTGAAGSTGADLAGSTAGWNGGFVGVHNGFGGGHGGHWFHGWRGDRFGWWWGDALGWTYYPYG